MRGCCAAQHVKRREVSLVFSVRFPSFLRPQSARVREGYESFERLQRARAREASRAGPNPSPRPRGSFLRACAGLPRVYSYDPDSDRYTYVWKTNKAWNGTCRQLVLKLDDGSIHRAKFKFR